MNLKKIVQDKNLLLMRNLLTSVEKFLTIILFSFQMKSKVICVNI